MSKITSKTNNNGSDEQCDNFFKKSNKKFQPKVFKCIICRINYDNELMDKFQLIGVLCGSNYEQAISIEVCENCAALVGNFKQFEC